MLSVASSKNPLNLWTVLRGAPLFITLEHFCIIRNFEEGFPNIRKLTQKLNLISCGTTSLGNKKARRVTFFLFLKVLNSKLKRK